MFDTFYFALRSKENGCKKQLQTDRERTVASSDKKELRIAYESSLKQQPNWNGRFNLSLSGNLEAINRAPREQKIERVSKGYKVVKPTKIMWRGR